MDGGDRAIARPQSRRRGSHRHGAVDCAANRVRGPALPPRSAADANLSDWTSQGAGQRGLLQCAQRQLGPGGQHHLRGKLADARPDSGPAHRPVRRNGDVLIDVLHTRAHLGARTQSCPFGETPGLFTHGGARRSPRPVRHFPREAIVTRQRRQDPECAVIPTRRVGTGLTLACALLLSTASWAQQASSIAGVVRDTSGAVLPGVTVEASSPALIEKVRTVVTDGEGRFNIVDLRPGTYAVIFSLTGFNTFRRDGIALTAGFTATVNADMRVGALEETITVTGAAPLVDTQNVRQQKVVSNDLLDSLPSSSKSLVGLAKLIPGLKGGADVGGAGGIWAMGNVISDTIHGKGGVKFAYDGMQTTNFGGSGASSYIMNPAMVQETAVETGGISAESNASAMSINLIPKDGGNTHAYEVSGLFTGEKLQSDNLSDELRSRGVTTTNKALHVYDANLTAGGPIKRDRLWFFVASRFSGNKNQVQGVFFNSTQGTPIYTPDLDRPSYRKEWLRSGGGRLTWQASPRNKISGFADVQYYMVRGRGEFAAPEAHTCWSFWPQGLFQGAWSSPLTSRLLLEAGASLMRGPWPCDQQQATDVYGFAVGRNDVSILESATGFRYNAKQTYLFQQDQDRYVERFSVSYVTGSHTFKSGVQVQQGVVNTGTDVNGDVNYTFLNGVPIQVTQWATPYLQKNRIKADIGLYAQDKWIVKRLTLNLGLRLDYITGNVPAQSVPAGRFVAARDFAPVNRVPAWTDLNPRIGGSYDLFGNGRTALKASLGRYVGVIGVNIAQVNNPIATSVNNANRSWTDADADYIPDCDLLNFSANGECGAISNSNFGKTNPGAVRYADDLIHGFGERDYFWDVSTEIQHQLSQGVSITGGYYRNWTDHYSVVGGTGWEAGVTDNLAVVPSDFDPYCVTAPSDPRLPGGGGYQVCGLYDVNPAKFGQADLLVARPEHYGKGKTRHSDFFNVSIDSRLGSGVVFGGSVDTGLSVDDRCFVVDSGQELLHCRVVTPFRAQTQFKLHGSYPLPANFAVSGTFQNVSGVPYEANYPVSSAAIAPSLGRPLAGGTRVATVPLIAPQTQFESRQTQLDVRLSKVITFSSKVRLRANLDLYNVLNASSILRLNNTYGPQWRAPLASSVGSGFLEGRLLQFNGQLSF
ncbi:MAG: hypothetical protein GEU82_15280 [Luteitalea sp.]|nr:hypothetical protein [Luteitalea sp.]